MTKAQIRETVEKQLQLLSDRSREIITPAELEGLTGAMIDCANWLMDNPEIMETTNTIVRTPEETAALAATIRDTFSKVAAECSIRQQASLETNLVRSLGDSKLKKIGQQISGVLLENGLTKSPDTCSDLFRYMESVVWGWNEV